MITKDELKDWLDESSRKAHTEKIEEYIDGAIRRNALAGKTTFHISTGEYTRQGSRKTAFYDIWYCEGLSEENRRIVQKRVLKKYRDFGFNVDEIWVDCGWSNDYRAIQFTDIEKVIVEEDE